MRPRKGKDRLRQKRPSAESQGKNFKGKKPKKRKTAAQEKSLARKPAKKGKNEVRLSFGPQRKRARLSEALRLVKSKNPDFLKLGFGMLLRIPGDQPYRKLRSLAKSKDAQTRASAIYALGARGEVRAGKLILKALKDENREVKVEAVRAAGKLFGLEQAGSNFRLDVAEALMSMRLKEAKETLSALQLKHPFFFSVVRLALRERKRQKP